MRKIYIVSPGREFYERLYIRQKFICAPSVQRFIDFPAFLEPQFSFREPARLVNLLQQIFSLLTSACTNTGLIKGPCCFVRANISQLNMDTG